jgi:hypothetical protein
MNLIQTLKISAKKSKTQTKRICQGDIFCNIDIIENFNVIKNKVYLDKISFPYIVCLNQECDLESDFNLTSNKDSKLLHLAIAPAFNFEEFLTGNHWGDIFENSKGGKRKDTKINLIIDNEIPRYHYLNFSSKDKMPELIIDFKHFFSINKDFLYSKIDQRICSIDDLYKEKISQRFSHFISRIGLPEEKII